MVKLDKNLALLATYSLTNQISAGPNIKNLRHKREALFTDTDEVSEDTHENADADYDEYVPHSPLTPPVTLSEINDLVGGYVPRNDPDICPVTPARAYEGLEEGFAGSQCTFTSMQDNTQDFEEVFEDCHGLPFPSGQHWYKAKVPFDGKPNAMWYTPVKTGSSYNNGYYDFSQAHTICTKGTISQSMPIGSHMWCPTSETETGFIWLSHPDQPFTPYPDTRGVWTGIATKQKTDPTYYCDEDRALTTHFDWGTNEPHMGKQKTVMLEFMSWKMHDVRATGSSTGSMVCELNCDMLTPCEALNCEAIGATCVDNGLLETSECTCSDPTHSWDRDSNTCSEAADSLITVEIPIAFQGMSELLQHVFTDDVPSSRRKRRRRSLDPLYDEIVNHGCHCIRLDAINTGLGGLLSVDNIDAECQSWISSRRCLTLQDGSCFNHTLETDTYTVTINKDTNEIDCAPNDGNPDQCVRDTCYVDAQNAGFIVAQATAVADWTRTLGDTNSCQKCDGCVAPAACSGTAPNVVPVSWVDFNSNGGA